MENIWDKESYKYSKPHLRLLKISKIIKMYKKEGRVLDIGCSTSVLKSLLGKNYEYFGLDISKEIIKEKKDESHFKIFDLNNEEKLPFKEKFDIVVVSGVLEYAFPNRDKVLLDCIEKNIEKNGLLIVTYSNMNHLSYILRIIRQEGIYYHLWTNIKSTEQMRDLYKRMFTNLYNFYIKRTKIFQKYVL